MNRKDELLKQHGPSILRDLADRLESGKANFSLMRNNMPTRNIYCCGTFERLKAFSALIICDVDFAVCENNEEAAATGRMDGMKMEDIK